MTDIFIRMLEIGVGLVGRSITFNDMREMLSKEHYTIDRMELPVIRTWFYDHFYHPETFRTNKGSSSTALSDFALKKHDGEATVFTGDGYYKYLQYEELQTAHEHARVAQEAALKSETSTRWAIGIAIISMLLNILAIFLQYILPHLGEPKA